MPLLTEDRVLLAAFRTGQPEALERVYRHYAPRVSMFLRRGFVVSPLSSPAMTVSVTEPFELENAMQEVFTRALGPKARLAYDGLRPYQDFLRGIARHVVIDELRRRRRLSAEDLDEARIEATSEASPDPPADERLTAQEAEAHVRAFLASDCAARDRDLYARRYVEELSQEAAAAAAGLTRIQVRRWEARFRARLLEYLKKVKYV